MPMYCYLCPKCGAIKEGFRSIKDRNNLVLCPECAEPMNRDILAEQGAVRGDYNEPIVSESMAFDAIDLAEHRKRFPDIEVKVDGRSARPVFRNLSQKRRYLKARGWVDCNSYM